MVPEEMYDPMSEQSTPTMRALLIVLQRKYEHRSAERKRAKETLLVLGRSPITGKRSGRGMKRVAAIANGGRPPKRRVKNTCYKEEAGTIKSYVGVCRFENSYITKACYRKSV